jgi:hypothetical protein
MPASGVPYMRGLMRRRRAAARLAKSSVSSRSVDRISSPRDLRGPNALLYQLLDTFAVEARLAAGVDTLAFGPMSDLTKNQS